MRHPILAIVVAACAAGPAGRPATSPVPAAGLDIVLRPDGTALVVERRAVRLVAGVQWLELAGLGDAPDEPLVSLPGLAAQVVEVVGRRGRLRARVVAARPASGVVEVAYGLPGLSYASEHRLEAGEGGYTLWSWAHVDNRSGRDFEDARLTLVSGSGRRLPLADVVDLPRGAATRLPLGAPRAIAATALTVFDPTAGNFPARPRELDSAYGTQPQRGLTLDELRLEGVRDLPPGRLLLYAPLAEGGAPVLRADTRLVAAAEGGALAVPLGPSHSLGGQRRRVSLEWRSRGLVERFEIVVRNDDSVPRVVRVREILYRTPSFRIVDASHPFVALDPRTIELAVLVAPGKPHRVRYTVEYSW